MKVIFEFDFHNFLYFKKICMYEFFEIAKFRENREVALDHDKELR